MVEQDRRLNPDISFQVGDMLSLNLEDETLAGIVGFYAIVNIPLIADRISRNLESPETRR
jgi:hypothetical protein